MDETLRLAERALKASPDCPEAYQRFVASHLKAGGRDPRRSPLAGDSVQVQLFGWDRLACNVVIDGFAYQRRKVVLTTPAPPLANPRRGREDVRWILSPPSMSARTNNGGDCLVASWRSWVRRAKGRTTVERLAEAEEICQKAREAAGQPFFGAAAKLNQAIWDSRRQGDNTGLAEDLSL